MNAALPDAAVLSGAALAAARSAAIESGRPFVEVLEAQSGLSPEVFVTALAAVFGLAVQGAVDLRAADAAFDLLPFRDCCERDCLPLRRLGRALIVVADPVSNDLRRWIEDTVAVEFDWGLAHVGDIRAFLSRHEETLRAMENIDGDAAAISPSAANVEMLSLKSIGAHDSPVVKLVHSTLYDALKIGASDIHLETTAAGMTVKYRVDGVLGIVTTLAGQDFAEQVISRVKVMSELDIAERRVPQDGRFKAAAFDREIDFRVSIMPSIYGEDAVLRVLDRYALSSQLSSLSLPQLGFNDSVIEDIRRLAREPYGMLLATGPTGSGKTTTLYAALTEVNDGLDKVVTIEDPVEYQLAGVLQIPVNEKKGLTFARGLRSILRHDPDKIMVGEIRDEETAQIAVQAALTGHLVFTTVHANGVADVIGRFMHMGIDPFSFVSAVNGIVAQRLLRVVCPRCAEDAVPDAATLKASGLNEENVRDFHFRQGAGCRHCRGSGYKGRVAIAEVLRLDDETREMIVRREMGSHIRDAARRKGTRLLREVALDMVRTGQTTLQEINRVTSVA